MSFYGGNQNGSQPGSAQQQQMGRQQAPGLQNVQQVLTPQLFNINVNPNQLHNFFNEHNASQNQLQLNAAAAAAAANAPPILLQSQQTQSFPVNLINEQLGVGVGQLISSATVTQSQMQGLPISMSSALNFPQTIQVHAQTPPPQQQIQQQAQPQNQQSKQQRVFTGTVTKIHDNFGFIDEEVFFQMGVVKGPILPKEGDRVLVEADFNASMPFKWNATRVQIVNIGGGLNSSLNNLNNLNSSQQQHLGFNTSVGMQKQSAAPPPPVLTSQSGPVRPHGAQPVTIVSNPHSVYSAASGTRGRAVPGVVPAVPPATPMGTAPREQKRTIPGQMGMPMAPDPPTFIGNSGMQGMIPSDRDLDRDRGRERDRSRERARDRSRERSRERLRERSRERMRQRSRERSRERMPDRSRDKVARNRSRSRDRSTRDRSRDRDTRGVSRDRSRERVLRERSADRTYPARLRSRSRDRSRDRDKNGRERSPERRDRKRDRSPEKSRDRSRERAREKETTKDRDHRRKSGSPASRSNNKDDPKKDKDSKSKEAKDKSAAVEKSKSTRDRSPTGRDGNVHSQSSDRSKRSRSRESVRTDKGQGVDKSRSRSSSPRRKTGSRAAPRYAVEIPKFSFDMKDINVKELQRRYPNLYVPSDFFLAKSSWMETFPLHKPFELGHSCPVQIMRKGVQKIEIPDPEGLADRFKDVPDILEPADASFIFKAKVMIPSMSNLDTIYRKSCGVTDSAADVPDNPQHIDRLINFIVGMKTSKHEVMALGGPWSPSIDGANPQSDPQTLINTAIRCVRALTGVNLSRCKHWYRFMELYYKRSNCLETVVFYLPDVWSCLPGTKEWSNIKSVYKFALHGQKDEPEKVNEDKESKSTKESGRSVVSASLEDGVPVGSDPDPSAPVAGDLPQDKENGTQGGCQEDGMNSSGSGGLLVIDEAASPFREDGSHEDHNRNAEGKGGRAAVCDDIEAGLERMEDSNPVDDVKNNGTSQANTSIEEAQETSPDALVIVECEKTAADENGEDETEGPAPTHFSLLTPKSMNVAQLKEELTLRNLNAKGLKAQLTSRLVKALKEEEDQEEASQLAVKDTQPESEITDEGVDDNKQKDYVMPGAATVVAENDDKPGEEKMEVVDVPNGTVEPDDMTEEPEDEHCIRLVNPSLILESQDDECSVEDGELKEQESSGNIWDSSASQIMSEYESIFSKFPADMFPIIKPEMKEEEIKMLERRYALPKNPRLLMYPSTTAKSGNFDCLSMTLGLLRDYRIIDKKEDGFEVSLFSEFFHEMLQRDFAFRIYREIVAEANKPEANNKPEAEELTVSEKHDVDKDDKVKKDKEAEPATKKRKLSTASSVNPSTQSKKTTDPHLLLSFIFFDVTRCGYITETDLEDLCNCIGLGLTRAQIRKVVQKVVHKGTLYYRKWTDKPDKLKTKIKSDADEIRAVAQGNNAYFPVFIFREESLNSEESNGNVGEGEEAVLASVDGRTVDVKKLLDQLEKCEKDLSVSESSLNVMKNSLNEAKSQVSDLKKSNETLKEELSKIKDTLKKSENAEKVSKESLDIFRRSTERYFERVKDLVKFPVVSSKDKSDSSKDAGKPKERTGSETKEKSKPIQESGHNQTAPPEPSSGSSEDAAVQK